MRKFTFLFIMAFFTVFFVKGQILHIENHELNSIENHLNFDISIIASNVTIEELHNVTFNIHLSPVNVDFDTIRVFVSGATAVGTDGIGNNSPWPVPLENLDMELLDVSGDTIYTLTIPNVTPGDYQYKYGYVSTTETFPNWNNPLPLYDTLSFTIIDQDVTIDDTWLVIGVEETGLLSGFKVYPNPTSGVITISTENKCQLTVTNAIGQVVLNRVVNNNEKLDLSNQTHGLYFITAKTNTERKSFRLIIE